MEADTMKRREFILLLGGAGTWPIAQQPERIRWIGELMAEQRAVRRVGVLLPGAPADSGQFASAFVQGLKIAGYVDGENVALEYRWAEGRTELLPQLAAELVQSGVAVIAVGGPQASLAAKSATSTVPIVAVMGDADVMLKLVRNFNRPNGNITGVAAFVTAAIWGKRLELLHEMMPRASVVAILTNPNDQGSPTIGELIPITRPLALRLLPVTASTDAEIDTAFAAAVDAHADGLLVSDWPFFTVRHDRIAELASRHRLPTIYGWREFVAAGGLISYGSRLTDAWHQVGVYVGRILKGEKPADLPVVQPTKFEMVINLLAAKALGLAVPNNLLVTADEVIE
jgi:putative tryptophan/tyrosine transport system substrate-binding protein